MKNKIIKLIIKFLFIIICIICLSIINRGWENDINGSFDIKSENGKYIKNTILLSDGTYDFTSITDYRSDIINSYSEEYGLSMQETSEKIIDTYNGIEKFIFNNNDIYCNVETLVVGEHFFAFHNLPLVSGAYFIESNDSTNKVIINKALAYKLFGAYNVSGLTIMCDGRLLYICGVVDDMVPYVDNALNNNIPRAYILYDNYIMDDKETSIISYELMYEESIDGLFEKIIKENILYENDDEENEIKYVIYNENKRFSIFNINNNVSELIKGFDIENGFTINYWQKRAKLYSIVEMCVFLLLAYILIGVVYNLVEIGKDLRDK